MIQIQTALLGCITAIHKLYIQLSEQLLNRSEGTALSVHFQGLQSAICKAFTVKRRKTPDPAVAK
jgi:hypothetical protein